MAMAWMYRKKLAAAQPSTKALCAATARGTMFEAGKSKTETTRSDASSSWLFEEGEATISNRGLTHSRK